MTKLETHRPRAESGSPPEKLPAQELPSQEGRGGGRLGETLVETEAVVAIERERDVAVDPDAVLDRFGILLAIEERLPRVDVLRLVEIAAGDEGQFFQADRIEDIVAVGDLPGVEQRRIVVDMFPEIERVAAPFTFGFVRMRGDGEAALGVDFGELFEV
jgi:hypothetical protein